MSRVLAVVLCAALLVGVAWTTPASATEEQTDAAASDAQPGGTAAATNLVKQANAPLSTILQLRFQDTYQPEFEHDHDDGNVFSFSITMPLPRYRRLLPLPQLSLLSIPAAVTPPGADTGFGDMRFTNVAILDPGRAILIGVGAALVFPTATEPETGQEKWQAGPAVAMAYAPKNWSVGFLAQNPISFAGDDDRRHVNALFLQPFITYQLGNGWFVRSVPQMLFNWESDEEIVPLDLGAGRVFRIGGQTVNCFVEPFWSPVNSENGPKYGIQVGVGLLYPNFWGS
jgi:hypothetical protein